MPLEARAAPNPKPQATSPAPGRNARQARVPRAPPAPLPEQAARVDLPQPAAAEEASATDAPAAELAPDVPSPGVRDGGADPESRAASPRAGVPPDSLPALPFPPKGRIRYVIMRGTENFEVGRAENSWHMEEMRYRLESVVETTGLAALFKPVRVVQNSEGEITADGLRPLRFLARRDRGGERGDSAQFDWARMRVALAGGGRERDEALEPGAQDFLSLFFQFAVRAAVTPRMEMMVATGKSYNRHVVEVVGEEDLALPLGELRTLHLRAVELQSAGRSPEAWDIWLARDHGNLPVRIRHRDRRGEVWDQLAIGIEVTDREPH